MAYLLSELNHRVRTDPRAFIEESEHLYHLGDGPM